MTAAHTFVGQRGTLTFDGAVVEAFGFSREHSARVHVSNLTAIKVSEGGRFTGPGVNFESGKQIMPLGTFFSPEEFQSPELTALLDAIRAAAPQAASS